MIGEAIFANSLGIFFEVVTIIELAGPLHSISLSSVKPIVASYPPCLIIIQSMPASFFFSEVLLHSENPIIETSLLNFVFFANAIVKAF